MTAPDRREPRGVLVDYAGVLTAPVDRSFAAFERAHGIEPGHVFSLLVEASHTPDGGLIGALEVGRLPETAFDDTLRDLLAGAGYRVPASGSLVAALFEAMTPTGGLWQVLRQVRCHGHRTALVSNSWGTARYPRERLDRHFDATVISGEVGVRKPEPAIFELACARIGVPPARCVFVDDLDGNVEAARALGIHGIVHRGDDRATAAELGAFLGIDLEPGA